MTILRVAIVSLLAASAGLPYAAPAVCAAFRPDMAGPHAMATHDAARVAAQGSSATACDFAECATAPVAPVTMLPVSDVVVPTVELARSFPTVGPDIDPTAPLTPPPIA